MSALRVAVVDDSSICRSRLCAIIEADGDLSVVAQAATGQDAELLVERSGAQVLVTDLVMPKLGGLEVIERVMACHPVPIMVVTSRGGGEVLAFEATRRGALGVASKPEFGDQAAESALRSMIRELASVCVVRHPRPRVSVTPPSRRPASPLRPPFDVPAPWSGSRPRVVGVGASAGGPPAVAALLQELPAGFRATVLVAQHIPLGYAESYARFLASHTRLSVEVCRGRVVLEPGRVFVPEDGRDLVVLDERLVASLPNRSAAPCQPSVDALLSSLARNLGPSAAGVVLSGIGDDGAVGLEELRQRGGLTLVQDPGSCAVYGMPKAAAPAAAYRLAPDAMARLLVGVTCDR